MKRRPRRPPYKQGQYYHLYNRGAHRETLFWEEMNYLFVLRKMKLYCRQFALTPVVYVLMPNHYHWLIRQDGDQPSGLLPQRVFNSYNNRYGHSGTLFEGHYKVRQVRDERHLLHLCRYIHANPVKDGLVSTPDGWPYSNCPECVGQRDGTLFDLVSIDAVFGAASQYQAFVADYLAELHMPDTLAYLEERTPGR